MQRTHKTVLPPIFLLLLPLCSNAFALPDLISHLPSWKRAPRYSETRIVESNPNGTQFVWALEDDYSGQHFFNNFTFWNAADPTNYVNADFAFQNGLAWVDSNDNTVHMRSDNTTWLAENGYRNSVRIQSNKLYNSGNLFILDLNRAPWGCAIWPAFWTVGVGAWPWDGEIDIIEGVHDNEHNQVAWHTGPDCYLDTTANFSGTALTHPGDTDNRRKCDGNINSNAGCAVTQWSKASYGLNFDATGGGAFAMKWDENGIAIWSFYRNAIPQDILDGNPTPSSWDVPVALLSPSACDFAVNFKNHAIIFDITICGDWAGNSYATTSCPGTCAQRIMDPANFANASWSINSLKVYQKLVFNGQVSGAMSLDIPPLFVWTILALIMLSFSCLL